MRDRFHLGLVFGLAFLCASCGGSQELVDRSEELDSQLADAKKKLVKIEEQLKSSDGKVSEDQRLVEAELLEAKSEASRLSGQLAGLRDEKESLENRFTKYRKDYPVN